MLRQSKLGRKAARAADVPEADPLVDEAVRRLRRELGSLDATDHHGRPLSWTEVAAIAVGHLGTPRVRDAATADLLAESLVPVPIRAPKSAGQRAVSPEVTYKGPDWKTFFTTIDED